MATIPVSRLEQVIDRFDQVEARMGATTDSDEIVQLSREHAELKPVADKAKELIDLKSQLKDAETMYLPGTPKIAGFCSWGTAVPV